MSALLKPMALRKCEECEALFRRPMGWHQMAHDRVNPTPYVRADDRVWKCPECREKK